MMPVAGGYDSYQGGFGPSFGAIGSGARNIVFGVSAGILAFTPAGMHTIAAVAGLSLAPAASPWPVDNLFQAGPAATAAQKNPFGRTFISTNRLGGIVAAGMLVYSLKDVPGKIYQGGKLAVEEGIFTREGWQRVYPDQESTRDEHTSRSGTSITRKSMRGESAQRKLDKSTWARSRASSKKPAGRIPFTDRGGAPFMGRPRRRPPKTLRYRKGGCPPGYRYDTRKKMCILI